MPELAAHLERAKELAWEVLKTHKCGSWDVGLGHFDIEGATKLLAAALAACAREEAEWWHRRVHYAAMDGMLDVEWEALKHEIREHMAALERAAGESK